MRKKTSGFTSLLPHPSGWGLGNKSAYEGFSPFANEVLSPFYYLYYSFCILYPGMKSSLIFSLVFFALSASAQIDSSKQQKHITQYDKKVTFDISLEPVAFFDVAGRAVTSSYVIEDFSIYHYVGSSALPRQQYGGMDLKVGVAIKRRFHFNLLTGISGNKNISWIPAGTDFKFNFLKGKFSPFIHFGGGYIYEMSNPNNNSYIVITSGKGALAEAGIGISVRVSKILSLALSPEYRFIYNNYKYNYTGPVFDSFASGIVGEGSVKQLCNQLGLKMALTFY